MMEKINPVPMKVHPSFKELLFKIQTMRIKKGMEDSKTKISLWRLTKTISNMIESNKEILNSLIEVKIDVRN